MNLLEVPIQHRIHVAGLLTGAQILDQLIGRHHIGTDLVAPCVVRPVTGELVEGGLMLGSLPLCQLGSEDLHGLGLVLVLTPLVLTRDHDPGGEVGEPYRGVGLVDVLSAGPEDR